MLPFCAGKARTLGALPVEVGRKKSMLGERQARKEGNGLGRKTTGDRRNKVGGGGKDKGKWGK